MKCVLTLFICLTAITNTAAGSELLTKKQSAKVVNALDLNCADRYCEGDLDARFDKFYCSQSNDGTYRCELNFKIIESINHPWRKSTYSNLDILPKFFYGVVSGGHRIFSAKDLKVYHYMTCQFNKIHTVKDIIKIKDNAQWKIKTLNKLSEQFGYDVEYCLMAAEQLI